MEVGSTSAPSLPDSAMPESWLGSSSGALESRNATTEGCGPESWLIATTCTAPLLESRPSVGNSFTQGAHQVAHRFTSVGLPANAARLVSSPSGSLKLTSGAG